MIISTMFIIMTRIRLSSNNPKSVQDTKLTVNNACHNILGPTNRCAKAHNNNNPLLIIDLICVTTVSSQYLPSTPRKKLKKIKKIKNKILKKKQRKGLDIQLNIRRWRCGIYTEFEAGGGRPGGGHESGLSTLA